MRVNLDNIAIVLHQPHYPENIGASARAACNMGINRLVVVNPDNCDLTRVLKLATHFASDLVEGMEVFEDLETALSPFQYVVGTTARIGRRRPTISSPRKLAEKLVTISQKNRIAIVFGHESSGLTNAELGLCQAVVTIPTAEFSSLNLAQAVMLFCYEMFLASREETEKLVQVGHEVIAQAENAFGIKEGYITKESQSGGYFNLWKANQEQLIRAGLLERNIESARICTAHNTDHFFSHRGEKGKTGRFAAGILIC